MLACAEAVRAPTQLRCLTCVALQVDSEGRKFGKSTGGAIWLSAEKLSPYKFYQYLFQVRLTAAVCSKTINAFVSQHLASDHPSLFHLPSFLLEGITPGMFACTLALLQVTDADVIKFLRMLTFLPLEEIDALQQSMSSAGYVPNTAQRRLAEAVTRCGGQSSRPGLWQPLLHDRFM